MNDELILRIDAVSKRVGYKRASIYKLMKAGKFPRNIRLAGGGAVGWLLSDIQAWIAAQAKSEAK